MWGEEGSILGCAEGKGFAVFTWRSREAGMEPRGEGRAERLGEGVAGLGMSGGFLEE